YGQRRSTRGLLTPRELAAVFALIGIELPERHVLRMQRTLHFVESNARKAEKVRSVAHHGDDVQQQLPRVVLLAEVPAVERLQQPLPVTDDRKERRNDQQENDGRPGQE